NALILSNQPPPSTFVFTPEMHFNSPTVAIEAVHDNNNSTRPVDFMTAWLATLQLHNNFDFPAVDKDLAPVSRPFSDYGTYLTKQAIIYTGGSAEAKAKADLLLLGI
ncbi:hypothetical protein FRC11_014234, partial [Ceratobasidium sp. 423]